MTSELKMVTFFDPPSGWKYGFPKKIPENVVDFRKWLIESGYPEKDVDYALKYGRIWAEVEKE
jgi:hypothetical protein